MKTLIASSDKKHVFHRIKKNYNVLFCGKKCFLTIVKHGILKYGPETKFGMQQDSKDLNYLKSFGHMIYLN